MDANKASRPAMAKVFTVKALAAKALAAMRALLASLLAQYRN
jgi:hypothetical protein